jgi:hypothetical protein
MIISKIIVEINGEQKNIVDLNKDEYEHFIKLTNKLGIAYNLLKKAKNIVETNTNKIIIPNGKK